MAIIKRFFFTFGIEDIRQRDFLKGHALNTKSPIANFIDNL